LEGQVQMRRALVAPLSLLLGVVASPSAHQEKAAPAPRQTFGAAVAAVVVDAVVRDSKGKPVTNLRKEDFELLEDGVRQEIGDVTVVMPGPTTKYTNAATSTRSRPSWRFSGQC
jgi:hypothetical protein